MKYKLLRFSLLSLLVMLFGGFANAAVTESPYQHVFDTKAKTFTTDETKTLSNVDWSLVATWFDNSNKDYNYDTTNPSWGLKLGSNKKPIKGFTLTSKEGDIPGTITSVKVSTKMRSGATANMTVTVGGVAFKCEGETAAALDKNGITLEFTGSGSGSVVIAAENSSAQSSSGALYVRDIEVAFTAGDTPDPEPEAAYYIFGTMNNWAANSSYKLVRNVNADAEEYMITSLALTTDSQFKVVKVDGDTQTWYPDGMGNNYGEHGEITADGKYDIYFRPNGDGGDDWHYNFIYVATHEEPVVLNTYTATFVNTDKWETVMAYAWSGDGDNVVKYLGDWPGKELEKTGTKTIYGEEYDVYTVTFEAAASAEDIKIIFNNGNGGEGNQTADLPFEEAKEYYGLTVPQEPLGDNYYQKVTATEDITDGDYLIVYEGDATHDAVAFNGALTALDAANNGVAVTITDGKIPYSEARDAALFTIDTAAGTVKSASGKYIGVSTNSNGLKTSDDAATYKNAFSIDDDEHAVIAAVYEGSTMSLRYNGDSNQLRFRYFMNGGQQPIALYKKVAATEPEPEPEVTLTGISIKGATGSEWTDDNSFEWELTADGETYVLADQTIEGYTEFKVVAKYSDNTVKWLSPESVGNFLVTEALLGQELALAADKPNMTFDKAGTFTFTVKADLSTLTITGAFAEEPQEVETIIWDFSEYTEQVSLVDADNSKAVELEYRGLTLVGHNSGTGDYVSASAGFHGNGASNSSRRYIKYTPTFDGKMTVTYRSNKDNVTDRITAIGTAVKTFSQDDVNADNVPAEVLAYGFTEGYTDKEFSAALTAGTTYYVYFASGGQSIRKLVYEPVGEEPEPELNTYTATFTTDYAWDEVYAYVWTGEGEAKVLGEWPGTKLDKNAETGLYDVVIKAATAPEYIIFNNGGSQQTADLAFENGKAYEYAAKGGDANLDGEVNTSDAVMAVSFALGTAEPTAVQLKAADINESGTITVSDAVGIVNIALGVPAPGTDAKAYGYETNNYLTLNGQQISLTNTTSFVAFQMDVTLAEGAVFNGVQLSQRANGLQVVSNKVGENTWRIIAFSLDNTEITGSEGELLTINANGQLTVSNIEFADADARAYALGLGETTGIRSIDNGQLTIDNNTPMYNTAGQRVGRDYKGVVIQNGKKYVIK